MFKTDGEGSSERGNVRQAMTALVRFLNNNMGVQVPLAPISANGVNIRIAEGNPEDAIRHAFTNLKDQGKIPALALVTFPKIGNANNIPIYNAVKRLADVEFGFHTVCMAREVLTKDKVTYYANVGLKVNLKFGGINHKLHVDLPVLKEGKTMVVGYDVIHPTGLGGSNKELPSQVGMVASVDADLGQWPTTSWNQKGGQEMLDNSLYAAFRGRLALWRLRNKNTKNELPENVLFFRDGVSESQYGQVIREELPHIRRACEDEYGRGKRGPKLTMVVSVKRHHTRFYPTTAEGMSSTGNVRNGTVVDRGVTLARYWDFFLTAHHAGQGTARPARYTVLLDEIFRPRVGPGAADLLEKVTHELCYIYGRATKAVNICPPAYYADIVCKRASVHMSDVFDRVAATMPTDRDEARAKARAKAGAGEGDPPPPPPPIPQRKVHRNIVNDMYYI